MLNTPHTLAGAAIAVWVPHPLIAVPLALGSHYLLDTVPHWQESMAPYAATKASLIRIPIDTVVSLSVVYLVSLYNPGDSFLYIFSVAAAANIADLDTAAVLMPSLLNYKLIRWHWDFHSWLQRETPRYWGVVTQLFISVVLLGIAL